MSQSERARPNDAPPFLTFIHSLVHLLQSRFYIIWTFYLSIYLSIYVLFALCLQTYSAIFLLF